jgi:flavin-dependent dehydrogenase
MSHTRRTHHDVVVIGARCAGSTTAMLLARMGHDVAVVDRSSFPSDTVSTHGIARGGVVQLSRWGLLDAVLTTGAPAIREVLFRHGDSEMIRPIKNRSGVDHLVAPRRHLLDVLLVGHARSSGAQVLTGVTATGPVRDRDGRVRGVTVRDRLGHDHELSARVVVGADGRNSGFARQVGAHTLRSFAADTGTFYAYVGEVPWRGFEFHVAPSAFAGVFPTHDGQACVWLCRPTAQLAGLRTAGADRTAALQRELDAVAPSLAARVRAGRIHGPVRGTVGLPNHVRAATGPGWALVGDAGYHRDPITGHGITDAFRDAELLAGALHQALIDPTHEAAALAGYEQARDAALRETFALTQALAAFPHPDRFVELQIQLSEALDREAALIASFPTPTPAEVAA